MAGSSTSSFKSLVEGYPRLSEEMGLLPQLAIFRRFGALAARNLLYMQAELSMLEEKLCKIEKDDRESVEGKKSSYRHDWDYLSYLDSAVASEQWQLVLRIRSILKEYRTHLVRGIGSY
jgi:hypothetical protein